MIEKSVKAKIAQGEWIPPTLKEANLAFTRQKISLEGALQSGQVSQSQYEGYLKGSLEHDKILKKYFSDIGEVEKAKVVSFRIECTEWELNHEIDPSEL